MKLLLTALLALCLGSHLATAHSGHGGPVAPRHWVLANNPQSIDGAFYLLKNDNLFIETPQGQVRHFPLAAFSAADQAFARQKDAWTRQLNTVAPAASHQLQATGSQFSWQLKLLLLAGLLAALGWYLMRVAAPHRRPYLRPIGLALGAALLAGAGTKALRLQQTTTDPLVLDAAFVPFRPQVHTYWNSTYFYVESKGIPAHGMMTGIRNWQQQVPVPQCYIGPNAWPIPLNPVVAATPVPVSPAHFTRGAIAVAANGVAIFNPYTNTGIDALVDGQLDTFGGHCGMADDYHYHVAPLSLYSQTSPTLPIAYGLDGFAVYGSVEPSGGPMLALDANHGHYGTGGVYHYHGTTAAPYMIGNMVGRVTEDASNQIVPQAAARPVRPGQLPLRGAVITGCVPNAATNAAATGFNLSYSLGGQSYALNYSWNAAGLHTFNLVAPTGTTTTTGNGQPQCVVPLATRASRLGSAALGLFPNPSSAAFSLTLAPGVAERDVLAISVVDGQGRVVYRTGQYQPLINPGKLAAGIYVVKTQTPTMFWTNKLVIE